MLNRLFLFSVLVFASCALANPYPPRPPMRRRPYISFKERLLGKDPIRTLTNFLERKFPVKFYYPDEVGPHPPPPHVHQQQQPVYGQPLQNFYNLPQAQVQHNIVYPTALPQQLQNIQVQQQYVQPVQPQIQNVVVPQQQQIQYAVPTVPAQRALQQTQVQFVPQTGVYSQPQYTNFIQTPVVTYPQTTLSNSLLLSEMTALIPSLQEQLTSENMIKVLIIRPEDMTRLKLASESDRQRMLKGSRTRFVDIERGIQELILGGVEEPSNEIETEGNSKDCVQPFCDRFLGKVIPEILSSDPKDNENRDEEPVLILKENKQQLANVQEQPNGLEEGELQDSDAAGSMPSSAQPEFSVIRAIEDDESALEILHATE